MHLPAKIAACLLALSVPIAAQRPARPATTVARSSRDASRAAFTPADAARLLGALAADSLEGRDTGSRGGAAAARILAAELRAAGIRPTGDSGYFQRVPLARFTVTLQGRRHHRLTVLSSLAARDTLAAESRLPFSAVNVVGVLRGRDPRLRDEAVVVSAHYDHVGKGRPADGDSIYNGADDNASGVVVVLAVARLLARERPAPGRTVVFLLTAGEERGALGTRWYADHPVVPLGRTVANLNVEMVSRPDSLAGGTGRVWLTGFDRSTMGTMLREAGIPVVPDPRPAQGFFERSDNVVFARRGIPAHTISSFTLHADYHTPEDEADRADPAHLAGVSAAAARAVRLLADGPAPAWAPGGRP